MVDAIPYFGGEEPTWGALYWTYSDRSRDQSITAWVVENVIGEGDLEDFSEIDLTGADLTDADLAMANLD